MPSVVKLKLRDFDHGLARALGVVALFMADKTQGRIIDAVTGLSVAIGSGVTIVDTPEGPALHFSGSHQFNFDHPAVTGANTSADFISIARMRATAQQGANPGQMFGPCWKSGDQTSYGIGWDNSATPKVGGTVLNGNGAGMSASITTAINRFDTVAAIGDAGNFHSTAWVNGLSIGINQGTGGVSNPDTISFGGQVRASGALRWATGDLLWAVLIKRVNSAQFDTRPTDAEMWQLYAGDFPHSLFRRTRRPWIVVGGSPDLTLSLSGIAFTAAAGSIAKMSLFTIPLTGISNTAMAGNIAYSAESDLSLSLTGNSVIAAVGTLGKTSLVIIGLSGSAATVAAGNIASGRSIGITGSAGTASPGTFAKANLFTVPLVGNAATASPGAVGVPGNKTITITGVAMTAIAGSVAAAGADFWHPVVPGSATWTPQAATPATWTPQ